MDAQWTEYGATFQWFISDLMEPLCPFRKKKKKINISLQQMSQRKLLMSGSTGRREYTTFNLSLCFLILLVHHLPVEDFNSVEVKHIWLIPSRCSFPAHHSSFHSLKVKTEHSIPKFTLLLGCICAAMLLQASRFAFFSRCFLMDILDTMNAKSCILFSSTWDDEYLGNNSQTCVSIFAPTTGCIFFVPAIWASDNTNPNSLFSSQVPQKAQMIK